MTHPSQHHTVLSMLVKAGRVGVCSSTFYASALPHARNRISVELKQRGHHIDAEPCQDEHETGYFRYRYVHGPERECPTCPWKPAQLQLMATG